MALWQVVLRVLGCQEIPDCEQREGEGGEEQSSSTSLSWAAAKGYREIRTVVDWIEGWIFGWDQAEAEAQAKSTCCNNSQAKHGPATVFFFFGKSFY
jgi:hypothetical protein